MRCWFEFYDYMLIMYLARRFTAGLKIYNQSNNLKNDNSFFERLEYV